MIGFDVLVTRIDGLEQDDLARWITNNWVRPDVEHGQYVFEDIDIARVHLIYELREDMDVNEAALPVVLSLLDQLYDLRRHLRTVDSAIGEIVSTDVKRALAERIASITRQPGGL
ncbi:MAG: chaperone modulator CbpM [Sphingobium sp.]